MLRLAYYASRQRKRRRVSDNLGGKLKVRKKSEVNTWQLKTVNDPGLVGSEP